MYETDKKILGGIYENCLKSEKGDFFKLRYMSKLLKKKKKRLLSWTMYKF